MRLGKKKEKDKDTETGRSQTLDNVSRLICSAKSSHNVPLKGNTITCHIIIITSMMY